VAGIFFDLCSKYSELDETNTQFPEGYFRRDKALFMFGLQMELGVYFCCRGLTSGKMGARRTTAISGGAKSVRKVRSPSKKLFERLKT
jgi:hypothetical protein